MSFSVYELETENNNVLENLIDVLKIKTFVWYQFECREKKISKPYFKLDEGIMFDYESCMKYVNIFSLEKESLLENYKLILILDKQKFLYKISFLISQKSETNLIESNNYKDSDCLIYPETLYVFEKLKETKQNQIKYNKFCCNIKSLFCTNIAIKKIKLIDKESYYDINMRLYSKYTKHNLNSNMIPKDDVTYLFFYHPTHCPLSSIYGFEYYNTNTVNLLSKEIRIQKP